MPPNASQPGGLSGEGPTGHEIHVHGSPSGITILSIRSMIVAEVWDLVGNREFRSICSDGA